MRRVALGRDDLAEGGLRGVTLPGARYVLLARVGGRLFALDGLCNHAGCLLADGRLEVARVVCPCHGMAFDVRSGALLTRPRLCEDQARYEVEVAGGEVFALLPG